MRTRTTLAAAAAALLTGGLLIAAASVSGADPVTPAPYQDCADVQGNLVVNCGFEDLSAGITGWTVTPAAVGSEIGLTGSPRSGSSAVEFAATAGQDDQLSQQIAGTVPGDTYVLGFWLDSSSFGFTATGDFGVTMSPVQGGGTDTSNSCRSTPGRQRRPTTKTPSSPATPHRR